MTKNKSEIINFSLKSLDFKFSKKEDGTMSFAGYASTFGNIDNHNDVMVKGCFAESLNKRTPRLFYQHNSDKVAGKILMAKEDERGLYVEGKISNTQLGRDCYELLSDGAIDSMSIGFMCQDREYKNDVRYIKKADLWEVSLVSIPANEQATILSVKNMLENRAEFKNDLTHQLRKLGAFSKTQAEAISKFACDLLQREAANEEKQNQGEPDLKQEELDSILKTLNNINKIMEQ